MAVNVLWTTKREQTCFKFETSIFLNYVRTFGVRSRQYIVVDAFVYCSQLPTSKQSLFLRYICFVSRSVQKRDKRGSARRVTAACVKMDQKGGLKPSAQVLSYPL